MIPIWTVYGALFGVLVAILVMNVKIYNILKSSQRSSDPQKQNFPHLSFHDLKEK